MAARDSNYPADSKAGSREFISDGYDDAPIHPRIRRTIETRANFPAFGIFCLRHPIFKGSSRPCLDTC